MSKDMFFIWETYWWHLLKVTTKPEPEKFAETKILSEFYMLGVWKYVLNLGYPIVTSVFFVIAIQKLPWLNVTSATNVENVTKNYKAGQLWQKW